MLQTICSACQYGEHKRHVDVIQAPPTGTMGGASCRCKGECVDGRYCPPQFKNTLESIKKHFKERGRMAEARKLIIPAITPEQLHKQDKQRRDWDEKERRVFRETERYYRLLDQRTR